MECEIYGVNYPWEFHSSVWYLQLQVLHAAFNPDTGPKDLWQGWGSRSLWSYVHGHIVYHFSLGAFCLPISLGTHWIPLLPQPRGHLFFLISGKSLSLSFLSHLSHSTSSHKPILTCLSFQQQRQKSRGILLPLVLTHSSLKAINHQASHLPVWKEGKERKYKLMSHNSIQAVPLKKFWLYILSSQTVFLGTHLRLYILSVDGLF